MVDFERLQLAKERVVFGVADRRLVEDVIVAVVRPYRFAQRGRAFGDRRGDRGGFLRRGHSLACNEAKR